MVRERLKMKKILLIAMLLISTVVYAETSPDSLKAGVDYSKSIIEAVIGQRKAEVQEIEAQIYRLEAKKRDLQAQIQLLEGVNHYITPAPENPEKVKNK
jgi:peptidoglycan hydrolase CwlO-like protein